MQFPATPFTHDMIMNTMLQFLATLFMHDMRWAGYCVLLLPLTAACRWTESLKRFASLSCVNNGELTFASRVSVSSDAVLVGTSLKSVWKLFLREGTLIGVYTRWRS